MPSPADSAYTTATESSPMDDTYSLSDTYSPAPSGAAPQQDYLQVRDYLIRPLFSRSTPGEFDSPPGFVRG
eukprot:8976913-Pyramimonas_sp.AAC.1